MPMMLNLEEVEQILDRAKVYIDERIDEVKSMYDVMPVESGGTGETTIEGIKSTLGILDLGIQGPQGNPGIQGVRGEKGDKGDQGIQGLKGDKGDIGAAGSNATVAAAGSTTQPVYVAAGGIPTAITRANQRIGLFGTTAIGSKNAPIYIDVNGVPTSILDAVPFCIAIGQQALDKTTGWQNIAIGSTAMRDNTTGSGNIAVGGAALQNNITGINNTAIGNSAIYNTNYSNCAGLGYNSRVTANNQVQLGDDRTTTYCYGAIQNRSDERDKANITDLDYNYHDFITQLKPRLFQWDYREDYRDNSDPEKPDMRSLSEITHDGTHTRSRRHGGFIAQEVKVLADRLGFDFSGYQDHSVNGGDDVLSLGYEAFIAPMVATIQDLDKENKELRELVQSLVSRIEVIENNKK